jgi:CRISPR-associated protein Csh1
MGFINAICSLGKLSQGEGLDSYLSFPLEQGGKMIRVALRVADWQAEPLDVQGVAWVDLADQVMEPEMKGKYLYRNRVGSAAAWAFTPIYKMGKPKKNLAINRNQLFGAGGNWAIDKNSHLHKIKNKLLLDYERQETFTPGAVDRVMAELSDQLEAVLSDLDPKSSHIFIFGVEGEDQRFIYPGEIPAFVNYFKKKLDSSLQSGSEEGEVRCAICHKFCQPMQLSKIFKFATADKVNVLHGLMSDEERGAFPVCQVCFEGISAGRVRLQMKLNNTTVLPKINIWTIPEAVGGSGGLILRSLIGNLEQKLTGDRLRSVGEKPEVQFFTHLAREGKGLVFHFIFWERKNAQELVHLMVEDVPPDRLSMLERKWGEAVVAVFGTVYRQDLLSVDWAIKSLYKTLSVYAGKSEGDKLVFRDFTLKVIGKMLRGERLPVEAFKQAVVKRAARLVYDTNSWNEVSRELLYAQTWVEYMNRINKEVRV